MDIAGRAGLFLEGKVSPELQGVEISITEKGAATPLITVATNEMGAYRYERTALYMRDENKVRINQRVESLPHQEVKKRFLSCKNERVLTSH